MKTYTTIDATGVQLNAATGKVSLEVLREMKPPSKAVKLTNHESAGNSCHITLKGCTK